MPKKKIRKEEPKKGFQYTKELQGLFLMLVGLIGFGNFGIVGDVIKKFAVFMFGNWYVLLLLLSFILGIYLISKRKAPSWFSARLIGVYTILIAILLFSHLGYVETAELGTKGILDATVKNIQTAWEDIGELRNTGGGIIGALFCSGFIKLFDIEGTRIVSIALSLFGVIMLFDMNLSNVVAFILKPFKKLKLRKKEKAKIKIDDIESSEDSETEEELDKRIIITSMDDLKTKNNVISYEQAENSEQLELNADGQKPYILPSINCLLDGEKPGKTSSNEFITSSTKTIERVLKDFEIIGRVVQVNPGPTVTQFEVELSAGTKVNKVLSINRELALNLAAKEVRIQAPIPGKNTIGIEIPNITRHPVAMKSILLDMPRKYASNKLVAPLGINIIGRSEFVEIDKTPHMLIAGATGSGKSVCINNIIVTILLRATPEEVELVLIDPKKVELNVYSGIPHLKMPVVTEPKKAAVALQRIVQEMDARYVLFKESSTKSLDTYNEYIEKYNRRTSGEKKKKLPYILIIIDELADLMMVARNEVQDSIVRITQLARAAGIHLIVATQRPSTDVITGLIKSNIPTRLSFAVSSSIDSRTILDSTGAEKLLGKGDMLYWPMDANAPTRIQGSMLTDAEISKVVEAVKANNINPVYKENSAISDEINNYNIPDTNYSEDEPLYDEIVEFAIKLGKVSASLIQRRYRIGYNRAARIIDMMEEKGLVGPANGSKPRDVLVKMELKEE